MQPQSLNDYNHNPYITKTYEKIYNPTCIEVLNEDEIQFCIKV